MNQKKNVLKAIVVVAIVTLVLKGILEVLVGRVEFFSENEIAMNLFILLVGGFLWATVWKEPVKEY